MNRTAEECVIARTQFSKAHASLSHLGFSDLLEMGRNPDGSITISTLGDYAEFDHTFAAYCGAHDCRRKMSVTLDDMIRIFGPDWPFVARKPPIKCAECGSRDISYIVAPGNTTGRPRP